MIKAIVDQPDGPVCIVIGLSHGELENLKAGGVYFVTNKGREDKVKHDFLIVAGEDEAAIVKTIEAQTGIRLGRIQTELLQ